MRPGWGTGDVYTHRGPALAKRLRDEPRRSYQRPQNWTRRGRRWRLPQQPLHFHLIKEMLPNPCEWTAPSYVNWLTCPENSIIHILGPSDVWSVYHAPSTVLVLVTQLYSPQAHTGRVWGERAPFNGMYIHSSALKMGCGPDTVLNAPLDHLSCNLKRNKGHIPKSQLALLVMELDMF